MDKFSFLNAAHTAYFADLYDQYLLNPDSVEPSWRAFFQGYDLANENYSLNGEENTDVLIPEQVHKEFHVIELINGYRSRGHLFTKTNPVRQRRQYTPTLSIENFGLSSKDLNTVFSASEIIGLKPTQLSTIIAHLEQMYCDAIGVEYMYIRKPDQVEWIKNRLHQNSNTPSFSIDQKKQILIIFQKILVKNKILLIYILRAIIQFMEPNFKSFQFLSKQKVI